MKYRVDPDSIAHHPNDGKIRLGDLVTLDEYIPSADLNEWKPFDEWESPVYVYLGWKKFPHSWNKSHRLWDPALECVRETKSMRGFVVISPFSEVLEGIGE